MAGYGEPELSTVEAAGLSLGIVATRWHGSLVDHMVERAEAAAKACGVDDVVVFGGGIIPDEDIPELERLGVAHIFTPGATTTEIVDWVREHVAGQPV